MAIDSDDEILQDFLVEAGEILELLSEQLIELEQSPEDVELLNSIFRGFHTVKGGAGFLSLNPLVDVCHIAEDVFDVLRKGERIADAALMDSILRALDVVNVMFAAVRSGEDPEPADPDLIAEIAAFKLSEGEAAPVVNTPLKPVVEEVKAVASKHDKDQVSDEVQQEFDAMLKAAASPSSTAEQSSDADSDDMTEEEFERLLDELHGKDKAPAAPFVEPSLLDKDKNSENITEEEFDRLLDDMHGEGKGPTETLEVAVLAADVAAVDKQPVNKEEPKPKPVQPVKEAKTPAKPTAETSVRVDTKRLDEIMNMVGELVLVRNRLTKLRIGKEEDEMTKAISNLDIVTADLQLAVMKTRMQPIKKVFGRFPRVVRDLARSLDKKILLELVGEETDLDKNLVEALSDPLVHLVRNAVDHGIETPAERIAAGKSEEGLVVLSAFQEGDHILLTIEDNGKGMDAQVLRNSAVTKGLMDEEAASRLTDIECYNLIFAAGFSTKTEISDVSGRGVGMDVVKTRISEMNGTVHVESELGVGSKIVIKLPLTLAIMSTLMVKLSEQVFALPLSNVVEILSLDLSKTNLINGELVVLVRGKAVPLYYLNEWLIPDYKKEDIIDHNQHVVVVNVGLQHVGFVVDQLLGQEEVVIKPLGALLTQVDGLAGATITGDGGIAIILDIPNMLKRYA
ncbi:MAG: chemotaxis protein CheA [Cycloclasticus sp.]|nr:chemotaxis protein CheA [Cycloclasticus sp.]